MSSWKDDLLNETKEDRDRLLEECAMLHSSPMLFDFLCGEHDDKGGWKMPPGSIQLWMEDDRVKVCWKIKAKGLMGFTVLPAQDAVEKGLEECLSMGLIDWRREGKGKRS